MGRGRYRFHLTNGRELVIDREGLLLRSEARVWSHAAKLAHEARGSCRGLVDWSGWHVEVYDGAGRRVMTLAFSDVPEIGRAA